MISGDNHEKYHEAVRKLGGVGFYEKPFSDEFPLKTIVAELLNKRNNGRSTTLDNYSASRQLLRKVS